MSSKDGFVQYHFRDAIGGFFEFPTENARAILPPELQPIEPHHGSSVLSVVEVEGHDREHARTVVWLDWLQLRRQDGARILGGEFEEPADRVAEVVLYEPVLAAHRRIPSSRSTRT